MSQDRDGATTPSALRTFAAVRDALYTAFLAAAEQRGQREEIVTTPNGPEMAWVLYERQVMTDWINRWRAERGLPSVSPADVERVEQQACGHVDYGMKLAHGCAELATDGTEED